MPRHLERGEREHAVYLMQEEYSAAAAARIVGCRYQTVRRWWRRHLADAGLRDAPRSGRPRSLSEADARRVIDYASEKPYCTAGEIKEALNLTCGKATIYR